MARRHPALAVLLARLGRDRAAQLEAARSAPVEEARIAASSLASGYLHAAALAVLTFEGPVAAQAWVRETVGPDSP